MLSILFENQACFVQILINFKSYELNPPRLVEFVETSAETEDLAWALEILGNLAFFC